MMQANTIGQSAIYQHAAQHCMGNQPGMVSPVTTDCGAEAGSETSLTASAALTSGVGCGSRFSGAAPSTVAKANCSTAGVQTQKHVQRGCQKGYDKTSKQVQA